MSIKAKNNKHAETILIADVVIAIFGSFIVGYSTMNTEWHERAVLLYILAMLLLGLTASYSLYVRRMLVSITDTAAFVTLMLLTLPVILLLRGILGTIHYVMKYTTEFFRVGNEVW